MYCPEKNILPFTKPFKALCTILSGQNYSINLTVHWTVIWISVKGERKWFPLTLCIVLAHNINVLPLEQTLHSVILLKDSQ